MPSIDNVLKFREEMHAKSTALIRKKGADYNREQQQSGNTLFNLTVCEVLGIVDSTESGILVRLSDKLMRLISLTKPGREAEVKDESVLDTVADVHNYVDYLALIWQERREQTRKDPASLLMKCVPNMTTTARMDERDRFLDPGVQETNWRSGGTGGGKL